MKTPHAVSNANRTDERHEAPHPQSKPNSSPTRPKPRSIEAAESFEAEPYWVPVGVVINGWPQEIRTQVASIINPAYRELVLSAKPGLAQSTGITIVHLLWLEIVDQIELNKRPAHDSSLMKVDSVLCRETRTEALERHLRLVHAKFKASDFLLRLQEFKARCRSPRPLDAPYRKLSAMPRRPRQAGK